MDASIILARVWGLYLLIFAISFLLNRKLYSHLLAAMSKESIMYVTAFFALLMGIVTISLNNVWTFDYRGLITFFGLISIFKGVVRLISPDLSARTIKQIRLGQWFYGYVAVGILLGLYLIYIGFFNS